MTGNIAWGSISELNCKLFDVCIYIYIYIYIYYIYIYIKIHKYIYTYTFNMYIYKHICLYASLEHTSFLTRSRTVFGYVFIDNGYNRIYCTCYFFTFYRQRITHFWFIYVWYISIFQNFFFLMGSE